MKRASVILVLIGCGTYTPIDSHFNRGVEYYDQGKIPEAIREYRLAVEDDRGNYRVHFNLAVCFHDQKEFDEALAEYEIVLELQPENARTLVNIASIRMELGKDAEARALLERAAKADSHSGFPRSSLGAYFERRGEIDRALVEYRASVAIEPGHVAGHYGIGRILVSRGEVDAAIKEFERALDTDPDDVATLLASVEAHEKKGESKGAMLLMERALVHVRDRADLWVRLSALYETQGRLEDAVAALWEARGIEPANGQVGPRLKPLYEKLAARER